MLRFLKILMPLEYLVLGFGVGISLLYAHFGIEMPGEPGASVSGGPLIFYVKQLLLSLDLYGLALLVFCSMRIAHFAFINIKQLRVAAWKQLFNSIMSRLYVGQIFQDFRFIHATLLMFIEFALLKNLIPLINKNLYDSWFVAVDKFLCGGMICSELAHSLAGKSSLVLEIFSQQYFWYYPYMSVVTFVFICGASRSLAHEFLFSFSLLFFIGTLIIFFVPTWGPVYYLPELFSFMQGTEMAGLQETLWKMKEFLEQHPGAKQAIFMISGFPSLHVAVLILGSIYLKRIHIILAIASWILTLMVVSSTIYLGWHYILDDVGSVLLVFLSIAIARRVSWQCSGARECL